MGMDDDSNGSHERFSLHKLSDLNSFAMNSSFDVYLDADSDVCRLKSKMFRQVWAKIKGVTATLSIARISTLIHQSEIEIFDRIT